LFQLDLRLFPPGLPDARRRGRKKKKKAAGVGRLRGERVSVLGLGAKPKEVILA